MKSALLAVSWETPIPEVWGDPWPQGRTVQSPGPLTQGCLLTPCCVPGRLALLKDDKVPAWWSKHSRVREVLNI